MDNHNGFSSRHFLGAAGLVFACCFAAAVSAAPGAAFVRDGQLLIVEPGAVRGATQPKSGAIAAPAATVAPERRVAEYWGALDGDRFVVTLQDGPLNRAPAIDDPHCAFESSGKSAWIMHRDGKLAAMISKDALRLYPAPAESRIAIISPERDLLLWENDECTTIAAPGRVSNAGWSPDGRHLVVSVYPPDWSVGAVSEAATTADFLRLQNADLYLFDLASRKFVSQLTNDPGTEYGAFFSPDGKSLYYNWLHLTEDKGGLMRLDLDLDDHTSASAAAVQLTQAGNDAGETPLGRVTTYRWRGGTEGLVFEAGLPDGSGEVWSMTSSGKAPARLAAGRNPQMLDNETVVFMGADGTPQIIRSEVGR